MTEMVQNTKLRIYVLIILLIIVWGLCWPINKMGLDFIAPIWFAAFRLLIGLMVIKEISLEGTKDE